MTKYYTVALSRAEQDKIRAQFNLYIAPQVGSVNETMKKRRSNVSENYFNSSVVQDYESSRFHNQILRIRSYLSNSSYFNREEISQSFATVLRFADSSKDVATFITILSIEQDLRFELSEDLILDINLDKIMPSDIIECGDNKIGLPLFGAVHPATQESMLGHILNLINICEIDSEDYADCLDLLCDALHEEITLALSNPLDSMSIFSRLLHAKQFHMAEELLLLADKKGYINASPALYQKLYQQLTNATRSANVTGKYLKLNDLELVDENKGNTLQHYAMSMGRIHYDQNGNPTDLRKRNSQGKLPHQLACVHKQKGPYLRAIVSSAPMPSNQNPPNVIRILQTFSDLHNMIGALKQESPSIKSANSVLQWESPAKVLMSQWLFLDTSPFIPFTQSERLKIARTLLVSDYHPSHDHLLYPILWSEQRQLGSAPQTSSEIAKSLFNCDALIPVKRFLELLAVVQFERSFQWIYLINHVIGGDESCKFFDSLCRVLMNSHPFKQAVQQELGLENIGSLRVLEAAVVDIERPYNANNIEIDVPSLLNYALTVRAKKPLLDQILIDKINLFMWNEHASTIVKDCKSSELLFFCVDSLDYCRPEVRKAVIDSLVAYVSHLAKPEDINPKVLVLLKKLINADNNFLVDFFHEESQYSNLAKLRYLQLVPANSEVNKKLTTKFVTACAKKELKLPFQPTHQDILEHLTQAHQKENWYKNEYGILYWLLIEISVNDYRDEWDLTVAQVVAESTFVITAMAMLLFCKNFEMNRNYLEYPLLIYKSLDMICRAISLEILDENPDDLVKRNQLIEFVGEFLELFLTVDQNAKQIAIKRFEMTSGIKGKEKITTAMKGLRCEEYDTNSTACKLLKARIRLFPSDYPAAQQILKSDNQTPEQQQDRCVELVYHLKN